MAHSIPDDAAARLASQDVAVGAIQYIWYFESPSRPEGEQQILPAALRKQLDSPAKCLLHDDLRIEDLLASQLLYPKHFSSETQFGGDPVSGETKERWMELCKQAVVEQDPDKFTTTIRDLIQALDENERARRTRNKFASAANANGSPA